MSAQPHPHPICPLQNEQCKYKLSPSDKSATSAKTKQHVNLVKHIYVIRIYKLFQPIAKVLDDLSEVRATAENTQRVRQNKIKYRQTRKSLFGARIYSTWCYFNLKSLKENNKKNVIARIRTHAH